MVGAVQMLFSSVSDSCLHLNRLVLSIAQAILDRHLTLSTPQHSCTWHGWYTTDKVDSRSVVRPVSFKKILSKLSWSSAAQLLNCRNICRQYETNCEEPEKPKAYSAEAVWNQNLVYETEGEREKCEWFVRDGFDQVSNLWCTQVYLSGSRHGLWMI